MWVISQDRMEVVNTNRFQMDRIQGDKGIKVYAFGEFDGECNYIEVGKFNTKERAKIEINNFIEALNNDEKYYKISVEE